MRTIKNIPFLIASNVMLKLFLNKTCFCVVKVSDFHAEKIKDLLVSSNTFIFKTC